MANRDRKMMEVTKGGVSLEIQISFVLYSGGCRGLLTTQILPPGTPMVT